ncbi:alpha/beta hydrolase [Tropheryma whipplei]|uniref:alpha/beta hydrolase n=1 Tax=Tropheryma whipplei TaxID=2039 RepID=UPI0004BC5D4E|nr:lysophospholipase [Tropheryma whipplei]
MNNFDASAPIDECRVLGRVNENRFLLLAMHGYSGNNQVMYDTVKSFMPQEIQAGISIVSLRAPIDLSSVSEGPDEGFAWFLFDESGSYKNSYKTLSQSAKQILSWLDTKKPAGIGLLGFSQGGAMCMELLRAAPEKFDFAVNISGFVWGPPRRDDSVLAGGLEKRVRYGDSLVTERRRTEVFWGLGKEDTILPYKVWEATQAWLLSVTNPEIRIYPELAHKICDEEVRDISSFLLRHLENRVGRITPAIRCRWKEQDLTGKNVVLLLHGYGSSESELIRWTGPSAAQVSLDEQTEQYLPENTTYISLQGPIPEAMGYAWFDRNATDVGDAVNSVVNWFCDLVQTFGKPARVGLLGFSQGGAVCIELLLRHPELFDLAVVLSGFAVGSTTSSAKKPVLWIRGDSDSVIDENRVLSTKYVLEKSSELTEECLSGLTHEITPEVIARASKYLRAHL